MNNTNNLAKIVWIKPSIIIKRSLILAGILATTVMIVSLMALVNVVHATLEITIFS